MRACQKKKTSRQLLLQSAFAIGIISILFCIPNKIHGQDEQNPKRGFHPAGSYALGDIETINTTNGNLILHIPMVSLPAGRAGLSHSVGLNYNSKLYDHYTAISSDPFLPPPTPLNPGNVINEDRLSFSSEGGWRYSFGYSLEVIDRAELYPADMPQCPDPGAYYKYKVKMRFPDGSAHEFIPAEGNNYHGGDWFDIRPDGLWETCAAPQWGASTLHYYSIDSTYMRLEVQHDSDKFV